MTSSFRPSGKSLRIGAVTALAALSMLGSASGAQTPMTEDGPHPAHIHSGTCDALGDVVAPLADVTVMSGEEMGAVGSHPIEMSEWTNVAVPLQTILDGGHAINVHLSANDMGTSIACGNIGGVVNDRENGEGKEIAFALAEQNDSGHVGIGWLGDDGKGGTNVSVSLIEPKEMK